MSSGNRAARKRCCSVRRRTRKNGCPLHGTNAMSRRSWRAARSPHPETGAAAAQANAATSAQGVVECRHARRRMASKAKHLRCATSNRNFRSCCDLDSPTFHSQRRQSLEDLGKTWSRRIDQVVALAPQKHGIWPGAAASRTSAAIAASGENVGHRDEICDAGYAHRASCHTGNARCADVQRTEQLGKHSHVRLALGQALLGTPGSRTMAT